MVVNLCDWDDQVDITRIRKSFGDQIFVVTPEDGNAVVFALKGKPSRHQTESTPSCDERIGGLEFDDANPQ